MATHLHLNVYILYASAMPGRVRQEEESEDVRVCVQLRAVDESRRCISSKDKYRFRKQYAKEALRVICEPILKLVNREMQRGRRQV